MSYEVVLLSGAKQAVIEMEPDEQDQLAEALRTELLNSPASPTVAIRRPRSRDVYVAKALSSGHVAVYRLMTARELEDRQRSMDRPAHRRGVYVFDILSGGDALGGAAVIPPD